MTAFAIHGAAVIGPATVLEDHALLVEDECIVGIVPRSEIPAGFRHEALDEGFLAPGFIDVQVNGGGGVLFNDSPTRDGLAAIAAAHRKFGSTGIMATLISDDPAVLASAIEAADAAVEAGDPGILGIHIEGPFLNDAKRGIHDSTKFRSLDEAAIALLARPGPARRMVTLAPELAPAGAIRRLAAAGVIVCAGHSLANYAETKAALAEGLAGFTHLFNAMTQIEAREPGMVGAALEDRKSHFGIIVDGVHVHPASLRVALAARGLTGAMLVTDAMAGVGSHMDHFYLGGRRISIEGTTCQATDGTLAGSNLDMATAFANAIAMLGVPPVAASAMASGNPARFLSRGHLTGSLAAGLRADLVHLDSAFQVKSVWMSGVRMAS
jgi:N-acetylglucosamine-6-phosphate deacetylase